MKCLSMSLSVILLSGLLLGVGCGPTEAEIASMVEAKVAAALQSPAAPAKATKAVPATPTPAKPAEAPAAVDEEDDDASGIENVYGLPDAVIASAEASAAFFRRLDTLMASYEPELPALVDNTDIMRCVTEEQRRAQPVVGDVYKGLDKERKKSAKAIKKRRREFYNRLLPLNFRIDSQWKTKTGYRHEVTYACWDTDEDHWDSSYSKSDCLASDYYWYFRHAKWVEDETLFLYSNTTTPAPPELMKRMEAESVETPERITCIVDEVERDFEAIYGCKTQYGWESYTKNECYSEDGSWKFRERRFGDTVRVSCVGTGVPAARIRIKVAELDLNRGDAISVPLKGVERPGEGALLKERVRHDGSTYWVWTVDAGSASMKVEGKVTTCPDPKAISVLVCKKAGPRTDPAAVTRYCTIAGKPDKVLAAAKKLQRSRKPEGKAAFVEACESLIGLQPADGWAYFALAKAHAKDKTYRKVASVLTKAQGALTAVKDQVAVAKEATRASKLTGDDAKAKGALDSVAKAANTKACELGAKPACKAIGQP